MKRIALLAAALGMSVVVATAVAAPAPKTTGGVGYTAVTSVQRHLTFDAIQSTDPQGTFWDVTNVESFVFKLTGDSTEYKHHATLTQNGQSVGGSGGYPF